jgi:hypothetical protein
MKKYLLLSAMLLAALTGCAGGQKPQPAPSDEVLIAQEDGKIRAAVVRVVQEAPSLGLPASLALASAAKGLAALQSFAYTSNVCSAAAPCSAPPAAVARQEGEEGHAAAGNSGSGAAQAAPAAGADSPVLSLDGPRPPADQRKAPLSLPGPVH